MWHWDERWARDFTPRRALWILSWSGLVGLGVALLMVYHKHVGLPAWFLEALAP